MTVGELFVSLGVKGSEKTVSALTNLKKGLGEAKSMSIEAKAGIIAALYAIERLFASSGAAGTGLTNFNATLRTSTQTLQQYQYAGRQVGITNQEIEGSFRALQSTMTKTLMGEGAPKGLARVAQLTGGITPEDIDKFAKSPELLLQRLQQYAGKEKNAGLRNEVLKSFNLNDSMIAGLTRNAFRPEVFKNAPTYSDKEIGALDKANIAWSNLGNKIEMAIGRFNAKHGLEFVKNVSMMTDAALKLGDALQVIAEKFKIFETIGHGMEGVANTLKLLGEITDRVQGKEAKKGDLTYTAPGKEMVPGFSESPVGKFLGSFFSNKKAAPEAPYKGPLPAEYKRPSLGNSPAAKEVIRPSLSKAQAGASKTVTNNIKQDLHFNHDGKDHKKTGDSVKKAVQDFVRSSPAQAGGF